MGQQPSVASPIDFWEYRFSSFFELQCINSLPSILLQDFLVENQIHRSINYSKIYLKQQSSKAAPEHHSTTTMFYCYSALLFMAFCAGFSYCLISLQNIFSEVLGIMKMFFGKCDTRWWFSPQLSHGCQFCPLFLIVYIMNSGLNWTKLGQIV